MTDVMFAKARMGEYSQPDGRKVRVIGYDATGAGDCVIAEVFMVAGGTGRCAYAKREGLR